MNILCLTSNVWCGLGIGVPYGHRPASIVTRFIEEPELWFVTVGQCGDSTWPCIGWKCMILSLL